MPLVVVQSERGLEPDCYVVSSVPWVVGNPGNSEPLFDTAVFWFKNKDQHRMHEVICHDG